MDGREKKLFDVVPTRLSPESMRFHASPVHEQHAFVQLTRMLGPRPELKLLANFIKFTRKVFLNGKFLRVYVENLDNKFTLKHVETYHLKATNNLYELKNLFEQMIDFVHDVPPFLEQIQFEETLDQLQSYFDPSTGLHDQFLDPIHFWVDRASELLTSSKLGENSENSILNESFNTTAGEGFPNLDSGGSLDPGATVLTSDQLTATLAPQQLTQQGGVVTLAGGTVMQPLTSDQPGHQLAVAQSSSADQLTHCVTSENISGMTMTAGNKTGGHDTFGGVSLSFKATAVSDLEGELQLQIGPQRQGVTVGEFTGARSKIAPMKFTDNPLYTTDPKPRIISQ